MFAEMKKVVAVAGVIGLALGATVPTQAADTGLQPDGTMIVGPEAAKVIGERYQKEVG